MKVWNWQEVVLGLVAIQPSQGQSMPEGEAKLEERKFKKWMQTDWTSGSSLT